MISQNQQKQKILAAIYDLEHNHQEADPVKVMHQFGLTIEQMAIAMQFSFPAVAAWSRGARNPCIRARQAAWQVKDRLSKVLSE